MGHWFSKETETDVVVNTANANQQLVKIPNEQQASPTTYIFYTCVTIFVIMAIAYKINKYFKNYIYKKLNDVDKINKSETA